MRACRQKQELQPPGFGILYRHRDRLPRTPYAEAKSEYEEALSPLPNSNVQPFRSALDGLMHGAMTVRVGPCGAGAPRLSEEDTKRVTMKLSATWPPRRRTFAPTAEEEREEFDSRAATPVMMPRTRSQDTADYEALVPTGKELPKHESGALEPLSASKMGRVKTSRGHSRGMQGLTPEQSAMLGEIKTRRLTPAVLRNPRALTLKPLRAATAALPAPAFRATEGPASVTGLTWRRDALGASLLASPGWSEDPSGSLRTPKQSGELMRWADQMYSHPPIRARREFGGRDCKVLKNTLAGA